MATFDHTPVLLKTWLESMRPGKQARLLDGTLGLGGHTSAFLKEFSGSSAVGLEVDEAALHEAKQRTLELRDRITYLHRSYYGIKDFITGGGILFPPMFTHILLDLGIGSHQLADETRGFSFASSASTSMRFGEAQALPPARVEALNMLQGRLQRYPDVADILTGLREEELADIIYTYGEERLARRIARALKTAAKEIQTSEQLASVISEAVPGGYKHGRIHPATRTFQSLRLAVNRELEVLQASLPDLVALLAQGGKIAVISFHSLEDRIVKQYFKQESQDCICPSGQIPCVCGHKASLQLESRRPLRATEEEIEQNARSRSAKMRIAIKK